MLLFLLSVNSVALGTCTLILTFYCTRNYFINELFFYCYRLPPNILSFQLNSIFLFIPTHTNRTYAVNFTQP